MHYNRTRAVQDNRETLEPIAVLFVLQTQERGGPDNRVTSDAVAVLFILQTQEEGGPGQSGDVGASSSTICVTDRGRAARGAAEEERRRGAVSYTHLTLPTKRIV